MPPITQQLNKKPQFSGVSLIRSRPSLVNRGQTANQTKPKEALGGVYSLPPLLSLSPSLSILGTTNYTWFVE